MSFLETPRFPETISFGARGGPGFSTGVVSFASGFESRNANWSQSRHEYEVGQAVRGKSDFDDLIAFFRIAQGRANGFRYKDFADYTATGSEGIVTALGGSTWQMYKRYTSGSSTSDRIIQKPVSGTLSISGGGTYTVDYATGIITKTGGSDPTGWTGEFDVPCRFDTDTMRHEIVNRTGTTNEVLIGWQSIPLVEIRV